MYVTRIKVYSDVPDIKKSYLLWIRRGIYQEKRIIKERGKRSGIQEIGNQMKETLKKTPNLLSSDKNSEANLRIVNLD